MAKDISPAMRQRVSRYTRDFSLWMAVYTVTLIAVVALVQRIELPLWAQIALALAPVAPVLMALKAYLVFVRDSDELQRRIQHESILIAAGVIAFGTFAYGFLETIAHLPRIPMVWILPAMIAVWGIASAFVSRRYR